MLENYKTDEFNVTVFQLWSFTCMLLSCHGNGLMPSGS